MEEVYGNTRCPIAFIELSKEELFQQMEFYPENGIFLQNEFVLHTGKMKKIMRI